MTHSATLPPPNPPRLPHADQPDALPRLLPTHAAVPGDLQSHLGRFGPLPYRGAPGRLIGAVEAAA